MTSHYERLDCNWFARVLIGLDIWCASPKPILNGSQAPGEAMLAQPLSFTSSGSRTSPSVDRHESYVNSNLIPF